MKNFIPTNNDILELQNLFKNQNYNEAEKLAIKLTKDYPSHPFSWKILGVILWLTNRKSDALKINKITIKLLPNDFEAHIHLGATLLDLGRYAEAEESFKESLHINPNNLNSLYNLGLSLLKQNKSEDSEKIFYKIFQIKNNYPNVINNLGISQRNLGKFHEAEKSFRKAIDLNIGDYLALNNLGSLLKELGKLNESKFFLEKSIHYNAEFAESYNNLGVTLYELGQLEKSEFNLKKAIEIDPNYTEAIHNLGLTLKELNKFKDAIFYFEKAIKINANFADAYYNLATIYAKQNNFTLAKEFLKKNLKLEPSNQTSKHLFNAYSGLTTKTAPKTYVEELFDVYAKKFEDSLVNKLDYKVPKLLSELLIKQNNYKSLGNLIDLGCGTGLFGEAVKKFCKNLDGLDISGNMTNIAKEKNIYDKIIKNEINDYLSTADLSYDYFIFADVFIYIGDLDNIFKLIKERNKISAKIAFSTEDYPGEGFKLETSGRYSHSKKYILNLCKKYQYDLLVFENCKIRKEKKSIINGALYILQT